MLACGIGIWALGGSSGGKCVFVARLRARRSSWQMERPRRRLRQRLNNLERRALRAARQRTHAVCETDWCDSAAHVQFDSLVIHLQNDAYYLGGRSGSLSW